jgi:hypothetical protein
MSLSRRHTVEVSCFVDIEQTARNFYAHAVPEDIDLRPGDVVTVHGAPSSVDFGQSLSRNCRATVLRAGPIARFWTRTTSIFAIADLYEVGFDAKEQS